MAGDYKSASKMLPSTKKNPNYSKLPKPENSPVKKMLPKSK